MFSPSLCNVHGVTCWPSSILRGILYQPYSAMTNCRPRALSTHTPPGRRRRRIQDGIRSGLAPRLRSRFNTHPGLYAVPQARSYQCLSGPG